MCEIQNKTLASPQMTRLKPLSPYLVGANRLRQGDGVPSANPLLKYAVNKKNPDELGASVGGD